MKINTNNALKPLRMYLMLIHHVTYDSLIQITKSYSTIIDDT